MSIPMTSHHLTGAQVQSFDDDGFLVLEGRIPPDLLGRLQEAAARSIERRHALAEDDPGARTTSSPTPQRPRDDVLGHR